MFVLVQSKTTPTPTAVYLISEVFHRDYFLLITVGNSLPLPAHLLPFFRYPPAYTTVLSSGVQMATSTTLVSGTGVELPPVIGDLYSSAIFSSGAAGPFTLATGAPGILVTRLFVTIDLLSTQATAGNIIIQFKDVTANIVIGQIAVYAPTAAPTLNSAQLGAAASSGTGYWYRSRVPNAQIQVAAISGGPLTAGFIRCAMNYALISQDT